MKKLLNTGLKWLVAGVTFILWTLLVVYASSLTLKNEWDPLTLTAWNELVTAVNNKLDISALDTTITLGTSDTKVPSQNAVKTYVDTAVWASGGFNTCPSEISAQQAAATMLNAINNCRNMTTDWWGWRLPTVEELACFVANGSLTTAILWTRTPDYNTSGNWILLRWSDAHWYVSPYNTSFAFRCVR